MAALRRFPPRLRRPLLNGRQEPQNWLTGPGLSGRCRRVSQPRSPEADTARNREATQGDDRRVPASGMRRRYERTVPDDPHKVHARSDFRQDGSRCFSRDFRNPLSGQNQDDGAIPRNSSVKNENAEPIDGAYNRSNGGHELDVSGSRTSQQIQRKINQNRQVPDPYRTSRALRCRAETHSGANAHEQSG